MVLAGGTGARLGGADKASITLAGQTLLERALTAVDRADQIIVVGPTVALAAANNKVSFVREEPPGGGPAAGLLAGRDAVTAGATLLVILAVDMPGVSAATMDRLLAALVDDEDGVFLAGPDGRRQLAGIVRLSALDGVRPTAAAIDGLPMHRLLDPLRLTVLPATPQESTDVDTWADLDRHREGLPWIEG